MESIKQIYRIGHGPSSSHTMGPMRAARMFLERNRGAVRFNVTLYGSLAATGKGHMTDAAILEVLSPVAKTNITWEPKVFLPFHPNGILFQSFDESGEELDNWTIYSIGGGTLANETYNELTQGQVYEMHTIKDIQAWCEKTGHSYWEYVEQCEGPQIWDYLAEVWEVMQQAVRNGLEAEGILPGGLGIRRKASDYMIRAKGYGSSIKSRGMVYAYALAVSEENACGGKIVTAPTCGSCGVMPAVLYHLKESRDFRDSRILRALATAGLFGNVRPYECIRFRGRGRMPGRGRCGLCDGSCCGQPVVRGDACTDRVCGRDGAGASLGTDLRPGLRVGTDSLYRTQCLCGSPCAGCEYLLQFLRWQAPGKFRPGGGSDASDRKRPAESL